MENKEYFITQQSLHELPKDERDYSYTIQFGAIQVDDLPKEDFLVAVPLEAKNQDINYQSDFCAAYAAAEAAEFEDQVVFVPEWTFAYAKWVLSQKYGDSAILSFGLNLRDVCNAGVKGGFLPRSFDPFMCDTANRPLRNFIADFKNWPESLAGVADKYLKENYFTVDGPHDTFDNFRSVLWKNMGDVS